MLANKVIYVIGIIAAILSLLVKLPLVIKILMTKSTMSLSLMTYTFLCICQLLWIIYGIGIKSLRLWLIHLIVLIINLFIIYLILKNNSLNEEEYIKKGSSDMKLMYKMRYF